MTNATQDSPAIRFLRMVWDHAQESTGHSWLKLNHALYRTLELAIKSGMTFEVDDFKRIYIEFDAGYWIGETGMERMYQTAVLYRHNTAWAAIERYLGRKPFIVKGASLHVNTGDGPAGHGLPRLVEGAEFDWNGERVKVTSFRDPKYFNAMTYLPYGSAEKATRYKITHADIHAEQKRQREEKKAFAKKVAGR